jgi:hypothetical protein
MRSKNNTKNSKEQEGNSHQLDPNFQDGISAVVRSASGLIPYFGDSIAELITSQMGKQWKDRITHFVKNLEIKANHIDEDFKAYLQNPAVVSLIEKGALISARTVRAEKREQIACLISHSLTNEDLDIELSQVLLEIFSQLNDSEIIWLIHIGKTKFDRLGIPQLSYDHKFYNLHKSILDHNLASKEELKQELQEWNKLHLESFGLISKFNPFGGQIHSLYLTTKLGKKLLSMIGIEVDGTTL